MLNPLQRARFWSKVDKREADECWNWQSYVLTTGYGSYHSRTRCLRAHRVAWELTHGPVPAGLELDHLCRNRRCCNPAHLEPVTTRTNILRGEGPTAVNARKTHCVKGHPLPPVGAVRGQCLVCQSERKVPYVPVRQLTRRARGLCADCDTASATFRCAACRSRHNAANTARRHRIAELTPVHARHGI